MANALIERATYAMAASHHLRTAAPGWTDYRQISSALLRIQAYATLCSPWLRGGGINRRL
jgi:hypothetical protein